MLVKTQMKFFQLILCSIGLLSGIYGSYINLKNNHFWVARLRDTDAITALELAEENGYKLYKKVTGFPDIYVFEAIELLTNGNGKRSGLPLKSLDHDDRVLWARKQIPLMRDKRDLYDLSDIMDWNYDKDISDYDNDKNQDDSVNYLSNLKREKINQVLERQKPIFNDELWSQEWYLQDTRTRPGLPKLDLNVLPVYKKGITGKGIRVAVLDDGLEYTHDDLYANYDPEISWDCNKDVPDPRPNFMNKANSHGTRCAGEIAMMANNRKCGVGIAFGAKVGGIKLLGGRVYDLVEGMALGFAHDKVDIYSSSWGPTDDGKTLERPGILATEAIQRGIREGRGGKGCIYVWASGNGGSRKDNCNCDGYAASIYTITVGSASQHGTMPWYGEMCSAILTVTYSSGAYEDQMITTTDLGNSCTVKHTGTSASAPLAAGIIALGLEANPHTTWRDVQHLIVHTAEYAPLQNNEGWQRNSAGFMHNNRFGFGLMNADAYVTAAAMWKNVPEQITETIKSDSRTFKIFSSQLKMISILFTNKNDGIRFLEHVELQLHMDYTERGVLEFYLTSPKGTKIQLLGRRDNDQSSLGFNKWTFMSVATWSEDPRGVWKLDVIDTGTPDDQNRGIIHECNLILHGTHEKPPHLINGPRVYNLTYTRNT